MSRSALVVGNWIYEYSFESNVIILLVVHYEYLLYEHSLRLYMSGIVGNFE